MSAKSYWNKVYNWKKEQGKEQGSGPSPGHEEYMYIIAGLGNPGRDYRNTRHNIGFDIIDRLAKEAGIEVIDKKHKALIGKGVIEGNKVILVKPQTYMNLSGESIREVADYYKIDPKEELLVISDDISLAPGELRLRKKGSAGGHNGLKSIIGQLGGDDFPRLKVGIGEKPKGYDLADYVLGHFSKEESELMEEAVQRGCRAIRSWMSEGMDAAMNEYNRKRGMDGCKPYWPL